MSNTIKCPTYNLHRPTDLAGHIWAPKATFNRDRFQSIQGRRTQFPSTAFYSQSWEKYIFKNKKLYRKLDWHTSFPQNRQESTRHFTTHVRTLATLRFKQTQTGIKMNTFMWVRLAGKWFWWIVSTGLLDRVTRSWSQNTLPKRPGRSPPIDWASMLHVQEDKHARKYQEKVYGAKTI